MLSPGNTVRIQAMPQTKTQLILRDSPFNGFHFGYTLEADFVHPDHIKFFEEGELAKDTHLKLRYGFRAGLECSYHFADFFGVSAALDYGIISRSPFNYWKYRGFSMPLKFEFHYPITDKIWMTANLGTQIRMPIGTFRDGYNQNAGRHSLIDYPYFVNNYSVNDRNVFYADIMADFGIYYRLPNQDYMRFMVGLNVATTDFARAELTSDDYFYDSEKSISITTRNHYLYFQIAYLHSFSKQRAIKQAQPHWNDDKTLYRHEFRLGVSDPLGFTYLRELFASPTILGEPIDGISPTKYIFTPEFSIDYHYRASKWFWLGLTAGYNLYQEKGNGEPENLTWQYKEHHFLIMPSLRFSYLNRPHLTLYSGLSVGLYIKHGREYIDDDLLIQPTTIDHNRVFSAFQLTAFGLKAGAKHWFGSFEAGFGIKGFANLGIGYEF